VNSLREEFSVSSSYRLHCKTALWLPPLKSRSCRPSALLITIKEVPTASSLVIKWKVITRKYLLLLFASFEVIYQEKQGDILTPARFLKSVSKCTMNYGLAVNNRLKISGTHNDCHLACDNVKQTKRTTQHLKAFIVHSLKQYWLGLTRKY